MTRPIVVVVGVVSAAVLGLFALLHVAAPTQSTKTGFIKLELPSSLEDMRALRSGPLGRLLREHWAFCVVLFSYVYVLKQAFSIPGSAVLNVLAGSLFGLSLGVPLVCTLTAIGASCCYALSSLVGPELLYWVAGRDRIESARAALEENRSRLFVFLLSSRIVPFTPNWLLNLLAPHFGVPIGHFFFSVLLGLAPYNFVCVSAGTMLDEITDMRDVLTPATLGKLTSVAALVLAYGLVVRRQQRQQPKED